MAKFSLIRNSFSAGKMSQLLEGRTDLEEYSQGCLQLSNFIVQKSGGATKRPGTRNVGNTVANPNLWGGIHTIDLQELGQWTFAIGDIPPASQWTSSPTYASNLGIAGIEGTILLAFPALSAYMQDIFSFFPESVPETILGYTWTSTQVGQTLILTQVEGKMPPIVIFPGARPGVFFYEFLHTDKRFAAEPLRYPYRTNLNIDLNLNPSAATGSITLTMETSASAKVPYFSSSMYGTLYRVNRSTSEGIAKLTSWRTEILQAEWDHTNNRIDSTDPIAIDLQENDQVIFREVLAGALPVEVVAGRIYFVRYISAGIWQIANTAGGTPISFSAPVAAAGTKIEYVLCSRWPAEVLLTLSSASATDRWSESVWNFRYGWPRVSTFFQNRLQLGGSASYPDTIWAALIGNIFHFMQFPLIQDQSTTDASGLRFFGSPDGVSFPFSYEVGANQACAITWLSSQRSLHVGTTGGEYVVNPLQGNAGRIDGSVAVSIQAQTFYGSIAAQSAVQDLASLFISKSGRQIRTFRYSDSNGSNTSEDYTILCEDLIYSGKNGDVAGDVSFRKIINIPSLNFVAAIDSEGQLYLLSLETTTGVRAWSDVDLGKSALNDEPKVIDIVYNPRDRGELWMLVERTLNDVTKRSIERLITPFANDQILNTSTNPIDDCVYLDGALVFKDTPAKTVWPVGSAFEGVTFTIIPDGGEPIVRTVTSGDITLPVAASHLVLGFPYTSIIETMPLEGGSVIGSSQSLLKRVDRVIMKLSKSRGGKYGFGETTVYPLEYTPEPNRLFSGAIPLDFDSTNEQRYTVKVIHDEPVPFTVLALVMRGEAQE
jgi:hypothetical protein